MLHVAQFVHGHWRLLLINIGAGLTRPPPAAQTCHTPLVNMIMQAPGPILFTFIIFIIASLFPILRGANLDVSRGCCEGGVTRQYGDQAVRPLWGVGLEVGMQKMHSAASAASATCATPLLWVKLARRRMRTATRMYVLAALGSWKGLGG